MMILTYCLTNVSYKDTFTNINEYISLDAYMLKDGSVSEIINIYI